MSESAIENQRAVQKPATLNPGTIFAASKINKALITSENNPRVRSVKGKAINFTTGFIKTFMMPSTTAKITALHRVTVAPGTMYVAMIMAKAPTTKCMNIFM